MESNISIVEKFLESRAPQGLWGTSELAVVINGNMSKFSKGI